MSLQDKETQAQQEAFRGRIGSNTGRSPKKITKAGIKKGKNRKKIEDREERKRLEAETNPYVEWNKDFY